MKPFLKRTWVEVNLDAIEYNYEEIRKHVNRKAKIMCVVKADAYGHGAVAVAKEYERLKADWLAVSNIEEALQLRKAGISLPILILGYTPPNMADKLAENNISQTVVSEEYARQLSECALVWGKKVKIHIKVDTGMNRIGILSQNPVQIERSVKEIRHITLLKGLFVEGMFTHFSSADESGKGTEYTKMQFSNFATVIYKLRQKNIKFDFYHCANSASVLSYPKTQINMVRPGIILYGLKPSNEVDMVIDLKPAMQFKTTVSYVKTIPAGSSVSYGRRFVTERATKVATVPVGYADGYPRRMSNRGIMTVEEQQVRVIGSVCMDQLMLDVTDVENVEPDDIVTIFGDSNKNNITVDQIAYWNDTINYEIICNISKRVPRIYLKNSEVIGQLNYIDP